MDVMTIPGGQAPSQGIAASPNPAPTPTPKQSGSVGQAALANIGSMMSIAGQVPNLVQQYQTLGATQQNPSAPPTVVKSNNGILWKVLVGIGATAVACALIEYGVRTHGMTQPKITKLARLTPQKYLAEVCDSSGGSCMEAECQQQVSGEWKCLTPKEHKS